MNRAGLLGCYAAGARDFRDASLRGANLSDANLRGANLRGANLSDADLSDTNLGWANLSGANLRDTNLSGANLSDADLSDADLRGADLRGADLRGANLRDTNLRGADLRDTDLRDTDLRGADLSGADLSDAVGFRFEGAPDPLALRAQVADHIEAHPELHDQATWGDGSADPACGTPCCAAGWACHLGGGARSRAVADAALRLLHVDGLPQPDFRPSATRESILAALRATPEVNGAGPRTDGGEP